jgi:hypothetical protein
MEALADDLEQPICAVLVDREVAELIGDQYVRASGGRRPERLPAC